MVLTSDQERIRLLLSDTVMLLCKNGLCFQSKFSVDAVIGITLDDNDVFLVSIRETVRTGVNDEELVERNVACNEKVQRDSVGGDSVQQNTSSARLKPQDMDDGKTRHNDTEVLCDFRSKAVTEHSGVFVPNDSHITRNDFTPNTTSVVNLSPHTQTIPSLIVRSQNIVKSSQKLNIYMSTDGDKDRPSKIIRLTNICDNKRHENASEDLEEVSSCKVTIKSEPVDERIVSVESTLSNVNETHDDTNTVSNASHILKPFRGHLFDSFCSSSASLDRLNTSRYHSLNKFNLISTASANQRTLSPNRVEKSTLLGRRSSTSMDCLDLSHDSTADANLVSTADSSREILSCYHSKKSRPSILPNSSYDENGILIVDDNTSSDHSEKDQNQQWPASFTDSGLKFPWSAVEASDNFSSLRDLQYYSEDFKPEARELYRPSIGWEPTTKNSFTRQRYSYPPLDETILQLPEHVARDCIQTILLYDGRYVPVRDIQRLRLCGTSSGMIRAAMIMLDDLHQGALGSYRELPTGVALLYKCPPERVDSEKLQSYGIGLDLYHMRYHTLPSLNATTRHCAGYWQRIESYSPYV